MSKIDLVYGNPAFLDPYWQSKDMPEADIYYPSPYTNLRQDVRLEEEIRELHKNSNLVWDVDQYEIVIGNGATQVLSAAIATQRRKVITAPTPYFSRFPVIAGHAGKRFQSMVHPIPGTPTILTVPNNPNGDTERFCNRYKGEKVLLVDACYNWPQYGKTTLIQTNEVIVYSLSKATGHAGSRIGWALVRNGDRAKEMKQFIEEQTMGVSWISQEIARYVLRCEKNNVTPARGVFEFGKAELETRWSALKAAKLPFEILNENGMFLWAKGEIPGHVLGVLGSQFGDSDDKFRLNIGCSRNDFYNFIRPYIETKNGPEKV